ncbi:unnamed protein product [Clonostachys rhizophaga]|uniref:Class II aldolase/adducin N-terminal domain-containing protein n=1 Tax=Clonostachys rhizophaga TaxID=160324 RepID=A0A9N9VRJ9_9HYPO|nr:unnamed protein product [Clonostachys rhizophaga]
MRIGNSENPLAGNGNLRSGEPVIFTSAEVTDATLFHTEGPNGAGYLVKKGANNTLGWWSQPIWFLYGLDGDVYYSLIKVSDLVLANANGEIQQQIAHAISYAGFIIHSVLHEMQPDINVAVHLHLPHGVAWSSFGRPVEMLVQYMYYFYNDLLVYKGFGGTVLTKEEGRNLANALGPRNENLILQNHGNVGEVAKLFIALERTCQRQLIIEAAAANGIPKRYIHRDEAEYFKCYDYMPENTCMSFQPKNQVILAETKGSFLE